MTDNAERVAVTIGTHVSVLRKDVTGIVVGEGTVGRKKVWLVELEQEVSDPGGKLRHAIVAALKTNVHATEGTQRVQHNDGSTG